MVFQVEMVHGCTATERDISAIDNAIYVEQVEGRIGSTMDIPVMLKNSYGVCGFQFVMELPEGTTINSWALSTKRLPEGATLNDKISTQKIDGNNVDPETESVMLAKNQIKYEGLLNSINTEFSNLRSVMK